LTDKIVDFGVKFLKKVVLKFFGQMGSDEFFLKHALTIIIVIIIEVIIIVIIIIIIIIMA